MKFNHQQEMAIDHRGSHALVLAAAGSGKTSVLTNRIASLLKEGINPKEILALTFTVKAAEEMKVRANAINSKAEDVFIGTFHSLCLNLLRNRMNALTIWPPEVASGLLESLPSWPKETPFSSEKILSQWNALAVQLSLTTEDDPFSGFNESLESRENKLAEMLGPEWGNIYQDWVSCKKDAGALEYDQLLIVTLDLLTHDQDFIKDLKDRFSHILVDEFQDTNEIQYQLLKALLGEAELFAVGDDDQSIYGFRGALPQLFLQFEELFPNSQLLLLEENYRSTSNIIETAANLIKHNRQRRSKDIWTSADPGKKVSVLKHQTHLEENSWLIDFIKQTDKRIAILYRTNQQGLDLSHELQMAEIEHLLVKSGSLLSSTWGRNFYYALLATISHGPVKKLYQKTFTTLTNTASLPDSTNSFDLLEHMKYIWQPDNDETYDLLLELVTQYPNVYELYDAITLSENVTKVEFSTAKVVLMTVHAAKGLEFPIVILPELEQGTFPLKGQDIEEERRLFYVALTRAKEELYLTYSLERYEMRQRSVFFDELPLAHLQIK